MERIIQEKISADHLLYVSLKYTKTTDVILNLIARWRSIIDLCIDKILEKAKVAITSTDAKTSKNNLLQCKFNIKIKNIGQLDGITQKIGALPTVFHVERE